MADRDLSKYRIMASYVLICNRKVIIVENANLNPTEIANFLKFAKMYTCEIDYVHSISLYLSDIFVVPSRY